MARPSNTTERRSQIARGLLRVMAERGYEGASIAQIAAAAGLTQGLIHYHFNSKEEILLALLSELTQAYTTRLDQVVAAADPAPLARLDALLDFHLGLGAHADPEALACWIFLSGQALRSPAVRERFEAALAQTASRLQTVLGEAVAAGALPTVDPSECAGAIIAVIQGYYVLGATARSLIPRGSAIGATRRMVAGLLGGSPGAGGPS